MARNTFKPYPTKIQAFRTSALCLSISIHPKYILHRRPSNAALRSQAFQSLSIKNTYCIMSSAMTSRLPKTFNTYPIRTHIASRFVRSRRELATPFNTYPIRTHIASPKIIEKIQRTRLCSPSPIFETTSLAENPPTFSNLTKNRPFSRFFCCAIYYFALLNASSMALLAAETSNANLTICPALSTSNFFRGLFMMDCKSPKNSPMCFQLQTYSAASSLGD